MSWYRGLLVIVLMLLVGAPATLAGAAPAGTGDMLVVSGVVTNPQGKGIEEAEPDFFVNGTPVMPAAPAVTGSNGTFEARLQLPAGSLPGTTVEMSVHRSSYKTSPRVTLDQFQPEQGAAPGSGTYTAHVAVTLQRAFTPGLLIATLVLVAVYAFIAFEMMHRTLAALVGASALLFVSYTVGTFAPGYRILTFDEAMRAIDGNVIFLLLAMMIIVGVLKRTGVFQWMAYKSFQAARGSIYSLAVLLMVITAVTSAFLDNVTTMLLIIPVTIEIALALKISPLTLLLPEVFASNVGGTATLIGDPPNIMIGSYAGLTFTDFVTHLTVICIIGLAAAAVYFLFWFRKEYAAARVRRRAGDGGAAEGGIPHHRPGAADQGRRRAGAHHPDVRGQRQPAHGAERRCPGRGLAAAGDQRRAYRRDGREGGRVADSGLLHDAVHRRRRG